MNKEETKKLRILELFGGIGACSKALERLGIEYEIADYVEIDKYACKSFNAIHNTNFEPQDICEWNKDIEVDLIMHGSPCQDFSLAGKQAGGDIGSGTRSSLMYETIRIVGKLRPKYVIWENVKNLLSKKHRHNFDAYLETMEQLGYKNYYQVLNAKDYGMPQNRERVFTISIYQEPIIKVIGNYMPSNHDASRIVDINGIAPTVKENHGTVTAIGEIQQFVFPPRQELKLKLKDMLEDEVDEKYYLSEKMMNCFMSDGTGKYPRRERFLQNINKPNRETANAIITTEGNKPTCNFIKIKNATKQGYLKAYDGDSVAVVIGGVGEKKSNNGTQWYLQDRIYEGNISNTITTCCNPYYKNDLKIRKLTPKECWRLMGFDDSDFEKASKVNSNAQLYKQAGNSIVVQCLEAIFKNLLEISNE